jgi:hypothetical protein
MIGSPPCTDNRSYFYPSVSASYVFSESFGEKPNWLNSGRLRAAYAEVGTDSDVPPYSQQLIYSVNANQFGGQAVSSTGTSVPTRT